ncbi:MAG: circularly permuted type 2 ATP-grasp protein, partial [Candidatus Thiodiazotropha sp. 6PLUC9]
MTINRDSFENHRFFDELITPNGNARGYARKLISYLGKLDEGELESRQLGAELAIKQMGITFRVYTQEEGSIDRVWPFDIIPRLIPKKEWDDIEAGLKQRVEALNLFIDDLYHKQKIVKDKVFPAEVLADSENFRKQCID